MPAASITAWTVTLDDQRPALLPDLDTALAYIRGFIGTNGSRPDSRAVLEARRMDPLLYAAEVELEDGAPFSMGTTEGRS